MLLVAFNERTVLLNLKVIIIYYEIFRKDKLISTNIIEGSPDITKNNIFYNYIWQ